MGFRGRTMTTKPLKLADFLPYQLSITSNAVSELIARDYRNRFGLKIPEWRLMAVLGQGVPLTQRELVTLTQMDKVTVNRAAKTLVERALIERSAHQDDGRSHHLRLSSTGESLYDTIIPAAKAIEKRLIAALDPGEESTLSTLLEKMRHAADALG
jgi:DNA-binding MarR family transcriptional regulator